MARTAQSNRIDFVTGAPVRQMFRIERLRAISERIEQIVARSSEEILHAPRGPQGWTPARRLGQMIAVARHAYQDIYQMSWQMDPLLNEWDESSDADDAPEEEQARAAEDGSGLLGRFVEALDQTLALLRELPDSSWGRSGQDPQSGRRSIALRVDELTGRLEAQAELLEAGAPEVAESTAE